MTISPLAHRIQRRHNRLRIRCPHATGVLLVDSHGNIPLLPCRPAKATRLAIPLQTRPLTLAQAQALLSSHK